MILALLLASYPVFQQGPARDGGLAWPVNCVNCSGGGGSSVVTIDGGAIGIVSMPPVTVDGGSIAVTNLPTQYPGTVVVDGGYLTVIQGTSPWVTSGGASAAQWTVVDGGYVNVLNFPGNLLTDGGVVNVGNFPAMWPNLQWVSVDGGVTAFVSNFPANLLTDGGVVNVGNFPATQAVSIASMPSTPVTGTFWPGNLLADGGVVNVGNFPAQQAQWTTVDGGYVNSIPSPPTTPWACGVTISTPGNTLTCQAAPGAGSLYLTDYQIFGALDGGATLTPGKAAIVWGTGTNCVTLDGGIVPSISGAGTALQIPYSANGGTSTTADFTTPIVAPALTQLCCHCSTWCTCQMNGYTR